MSGAFGMDIYVIESSPECYHLVSFDIMTLEDVFKVQCYCAYAGDFLDVKMSALFDGFINRQWNALRVSEKGKKPKPKFIKLFTNGNRPKALKHFRFYQHYVDIPSPIDTKLYFAYGNVLITVYNTGLGVKPKPYSLQDSLLALNERKHRKKSLKY